MASAQSCIRFLFALVLLGMGSMLLGFPVYRAESVHGLLAGSTQILIATVEKTSRSAGGGLKQSVVTPNWIIKGANPGDHTLITVRSGISLHQGRQYLFVNVGGEVGESKFPAIGEIGAVELPPGLDVDVVQKLSPKKQVETILHARWLWVKAELESLMREKKAIEMVLSAARPLGSTEPN